MQSPKQQLETILTPTDRLSVNDRGHLLIEDISAAQLIQQFGSPLYVFSEATLRANFRRIQSAFSSAWPEPVNIMYAIKANPNLAVRAILHQEGAGGDCFSEGELFATFKAGADPQKIALNGSCKNQTCLQIAVERGIVVNIDNQTEIDLLRDICQSQSKRVRVNIRLKPLSDTYNETITDYFGGEKLAEHVRRAKWGFSLESAAQLIGRIQRIPELQLAGLSCHVGRVSQGLTFVRNFGRALGKMVVQLNRKTGFTPRILDIGGGWARERDPESKALALHTTRVESLAKACCEEILEQLGTHEIATPDLWVEPGRFIVGNASVLLSTVGAIKKDLGMCWVNIDASTNDLPRIDTSGSAYHVLAASRMHRLSDQVADVVGPICIDSTFGKDVHLPQLDCGEPIVILDAGMYSESASTQFNSVPRPATVLVKGSTVEIIKEREQLNDLFRLHHIPQRLT